MPDPIPVASAPAAAAPNSTPPQVTPPVAPTPPAAPAADAPAAPEQKTNRTIAKNLADLLTKPTKPLTAEPKKAEPATKPDPAATAKPKGDDKPIKVKKAAAAPKPEDTPPPVPKREAPAKTADPTSPATAPKAETDEEFEQSLLEEERAQLDDARAAEKFLPEKYKGHAAKQRDFLKENAAKSALVEKGELDAQDYKEWYEKARPKIGPLDFRAIERARVKEELTKDFEPKIQEERHARWTEAEAPKIKRKGDEVYTKLTNTALPDEVMTAIAERTKGVTDQAEYVKKVQEVQQEYALEFEVAEGIIKQATDDLEEFHRLVTINPATGKPVKARNADLNTEEGKWHAQIAKMAHELCDEFKTTGGTELRRDGKWFATWREWNDMSPEQQAGWWTFSNDELAQRAMGKVKGVVTAEVKRRNDYLESRGYKRQRAAASAPVVPSAPPTPGAPPAPRPAPPPAGGGQPPVSAGARLASRLL